MSLTSLLVGRTSIVFATKERMEEGAPEGPEKEGGERAFLDIISGRNPPSFTVRKNVAGTGVQGGDE